MKSFNSLSLFPSYLLPPTDIIHVLSFLNSTVSSFFFRMEGGYDPKRVAELQEQMKHLSAEEREAIRNEKLAELEDLQNFRNM